MRTRIASFPTNMVRLYTGGIDCKLKHELIARNRLEIIQTNRLSTENDIFFIDRKIALCLKNLAPGTSSVIKMEAYTMVRT